MISAAIKKALPYQVRGIARNVRAMCCGQSDSGTHDEMSPEQMLEHKLRQVADYGEFAALGDDVFAERTILEIGPGNNLVVGLMLLAKGARQVVCIDRFRSRPNSEQARRVYSLLYDRMTPDEKRGCGSVFTGDTPIVSRFLDHRLVYLWDCGIEEACIRLGRDRFDCIVSYSVLEHVASVETAVRSMYALLKPGGWMIHRVDLRSHEDDRDAKVPSLEFLTFSSRLWRWMTSHTGEPNRVRESGYRQFLAEIGFELVRVEVTRRYDLQEVQRVRPRLGREFRNLPDEELTHAGIVFQARKPDSGAIRAHV